jgi:hypothetical protein
LAGKEYEGHLLPVGVRLPEGDTVLLGHVAALGQHLRVGDRLFSCKHFTPNEMADIMRRRSGKMSGKLAKFVLRKYLTL